MIIAALALAMLPPPAVVRSAPDVPRAMSTTTITDAQVEHVSLVCHAAFMAFMKGDKDYLTRTFDKARTPVVDRLFVTRACTFWTLGYGAGLDAIK